MRQNILARLAPWPREAKDAPFYPAPPDRANCDAVRISFVLSRLEADRAIDLLLAISEARQKLYVADFTLPERNLALPAHGLARLLGFGVKRSFWQAGALWGLAAKASLEPFYERHFFAGAATLAGFARGCKNG